MANVRHINPLAVRVTLALIAVVVVIATIVGLLWYLSYRSTDTLPATLAVAGLSAPAEVQWYDDGAPVITVDDERSFFAALGYVHGQRDSWAATLWRQTALGRLAEWFGEETLPLDRHARVLGFGDLARTAYEELPAAERALLDAYAEGFNAALAQRTVRARDEFVLLRINPEPWEPWHTLAIERLMAWLSTAPLSVEDAPGILEGGPVARPAIEHDSLRASAVFRAPPEVLTTFLTRDRRLREWLHLFGFDESLAWAAHDSSGVSLFQRHTYGRSALPLVRDVVWQQADGSNITVATIPGTLMTPGGKAESHAWVVLLNGEADLEWRNADAPEDVHERLERIKSMSGDEELVTARTTLEGELLLSDQDVGPHPNSQLVLRWPGFAAGTDLSAWQALRSGSSPSFQLIDGSGLRVDADGGMEVLGTPNLAYETSGGVLVSNGPWASTVARQWEVQFESGDVADPLTWADDTFSLWAQETVRALVEVLEQQPFPSDSVSEALTYLRNWNHHYAQSSIAATIFDRWAAFFRDAYGTFPSRESIGTTWQEREEYYHLLQETVAHLREAYGEDTSLWRWEDAAARQRLYPVWSSPDLDRIAGRRNFPPQRIPGRGHPTAPSGGPSSLNDDPDVSATWEGWILLRQGDDYFVSRQHESQPRGFQARILGASPAPDPDTLHAPAALLRTTMLRPTN